MSQICVHTEDNDDNIKGRINENSLQHKLMTMLKYLQSGVLSG